MTASSSLLVLLALTVVSAQVTLPAEQCDINVPYVCRGSYHFIDCATERPEACATIGRGFVCLPGFKDFDSACQPTSPCTSAGPRAIPGAGVNVPVLCPYYTSCEDRGNKNFEIFVHRCGRDFEYSATKKSCVPVSEANCSKKFVGCVPGTRTPTTKKCEEFNYCTAQGTFAVRSCAPPTPYFSIESLACVATNTNNAVCGTRTDATTDPNLNPQPCTTLNTKVEVKDDCRQFTECTSTGFQIRKTCPFDFAFDTVKSQCVPDISVCGIRPYTARNLKRNPEINRYFTSLRH
ncbi:hypothetical protein B566_EDAN004622 [Ephemera danica]|nr:hypothetical protein B566_EDAN004622 [Ephemera danica]